VGSSACPGIDTQVCKESRFYVSFKGRGNRSKVTCTMSQARWSVTSIEPTMFGSFLDILVSQYSFSVSVNHAILKFGFVWFNHITVLPVTSKMSLILLTCS
jgi:hypothetical protein